MICLFKEQAEIFLQQDSFEVDMSFKRIRDSNIHEIVFAKFIPEVNKGM